MRIDGNDEFDWFFLSIPLVCIPVFIAYLWLWAPSHSKPPANTAVFGCYSAPDSPSIRLDAAGMQIRQSGFPLIGFHLEKDKTGFDLTAEAPIRADRVGGVYRFDIDRRGSGLFLPFYRVQDGHTYGVFDPALLENFQMLATDGTWLYYRPAPEASCATS